MSKNSNPFMKSVGIVAIRSNETCSAYRARIPGFITWLCLVSLMASPALAGDLARSYEEATATADAQASANSTKDYFTKTLLPFYASKFAPVLKSCFKTVDKPNSASFSFVVAIGADGHVERLYRDRETNISRCLRGSLVKEMFPAPPESPYYFRVDMTFADDSATQGSPQRNAPPLIREPNKYSYTFGVPKGWEFSFEEAQKFGGRLVFFPTGGNFDTSNSIVYVNEIKDLCGGDCTGALSRAITQTLEEARSDSPTLRATTESPSKTAEGGEASVRMLTGARDPRQAKEALAFIEHGEAIVLVVLTTKDTKTWQHDYDAFREIVSGHRFFTCNTPGLATPCR